MFLLKKIVVRQLSLIFIIILVQFFTFYSPIQRRVGAYEYRTSIVGPGRVLYNIDDVWRNLLLRNQFHSYSMLRAVACIQAINAIPWTVRKHPWTYPGS